MGTTTEKTIRNWAKGISGIFDRTTKSIFLLKTKKSFQNTDLYNLNWIQILYCKKWGSPLIPHVRLLVRRTVIYNFLESQNSYYTSTRALLYHLGDMSRQNCIYDGNLTNSLCSQATLVGQSDSLGNEPNCSQLEFDLHSLIQFPYFHRAATTHSITNSLIRYNNDNWFSEYGSLICLSFKEILTDRTTNQQTETRLPII